MKKVQTQNLLIVLLIVLLALSVRPSYSGSFHFGIISSVKDKAEEIKEEKEKQEQEQETQRDSIPVDNLPTISITSPADGSSVFATVTVTVNTTDDQGITKVEFYVDGTLKETDTTSPYSYSWDTTQSTNGAHTIKATVYDTANQTASSQCSVTVSNVSGDNAPTITLTAPADGATVSGTVSVTATASDDKGVSKVEFYIDGTLKSTDTTSPYSYSWDTVQYSSGTHTVKATAYDTANQTAIAQSSVTISDWELVWNDEFSGSEVDLNKWTFEIGNGQGGWGTGQLDYATSRLENAQVKDGELILTIRKENYGGFQYTASRMITKGKANFLYGRIEIRAKAIYSQGLGMAFWMLGANYEDPDWWWPKCGEIDILEITGKDPGLNIGTAHFEESWGHHYSQGSYTLPGGQRFADDYHLFSIEWDEDNIVWYVDSVKLNDFDISNPINGRRPFNNEFFLILSTGVGGNYSGNPDTTSVFPMTAYVDWVRVYKKRK